MRRSVLHRAARARGRLWRWWQEDRDAAYDARYDDYRRSERGSTQERHSAGAQRRRSTVWIRPLVEPCARVGNSLHPRSRTCRSSPICGRSPKARRTRSDACEQARDHIHRARSLLHEGDRSREECSTCPAVPWCQAHGSRGQPRREGAGGAASCWYFQAFRRLEGAGPGLRRASLGALVAVVSLSVAAHAAADAGKAHKVTAPPTLALGRWSQQDDRSHASIGASIRVERREPGRDAVSAPLPGPALTGS